MAKDGRQQVRIEEGLLAQFNRVLTQVPGKTLKEETGLTTQRLTTIGMLKHAFESEIPIISGLVQRFYREPARKSDEEIAAALSIGTPG
jgi:hypothetical protein